MKKVLATVLALSTVASLGVTAFAAENIAVTEYVYDDVTPRIILMADDNTTAVSNNTDALVNPDSSYYFLLPGIEIGTVNGGGSTFGWNSGNLKITTDTGVVAAGGTITNDLFVDKDLFKAKFDKGDDNAKMIKKLSLSEKSINGNRGPWVKVDINADMTDKEFKISPSVTLSVKKDISRGTGATEVVLKAGTKITIDFASQWVGNAKNGGGDLDYAAGKGGVYAKPEKNDDNEVIWHDENDDLAKLTFQGDSAVKIIFPKLSTKWDNSQYAEQFADQDAFRRDYVGTPDLSSTSRAVLDLYVPYIDEDDEVYVDEAEIIVYEETEDGLVDITEKGEFITNDNDELVFRMKTRHLGTYIFATAPAATAEDEEPTDEPVDTEGDKANPGTGF